MLRASPITKSERSHYRAPSSAPYGASWAFGVLLATLAGCSDDGSKVISNPDNMGASKPRGGTGGRGGKGGAAGKAGQVAVDGPGGMGGDTADAGEAGTNDSSAGRGGRVGVAGSSSRAGGGAGRAGVGGKGGHSGADGSGVCDHRCLLAKLIEAEGGTDCQMCESQPDTCHYETSTGTGSMEHYRDACLNMPGLAKEGKGAGKPRADLCIALLTCVRKSGCAKEYNITDCLCGKDVLPDLCTADFDKYKDGPCREEGLAAAEVPENSTNKGAVWAANFSDSAYAIGRVDAVIEMCDYLYCGPQCGIGPTPGDSAGAGGAASPGGAGGASGTGPAGAGGAGGTAG